MTDQKYLKIELVDCERWLPIIIDGVVSNYQISDYGRIMNIKTRKFLKPIIEGAGGYYRVKIYLEVKSYVHMYIHRLVAKKFIINSDPDNKIYVIHKDRNLQNNHYTNLEWSDIRKNLPKGIKHFRNKYTEDQIHQVCKLLVLKTSFKLISEITGVSICLCYNIKCRKNWKHISKDYKFPK